MAQLVLRWVWVCLLVSLSACVGSSPSSTSDASAPDAGRETARDAGPHPDATSGLLDASGLLDGASAHDGATTDAADGSTPTCKTACAQDDCGELTDDGCGATLDCRRNCQDGQVCGLKRPDKCDYPDPQTCTPKTAASVCANKCGAVSDGCSSTIECTAQNGGLTCSAGQQLCGGYDGNRHDNTCVDIPVPPCVPRTCESMGYQCGTASDGCGHVLDCTQEAGGCSGGQICYFGAETSGKKPNHCVTPDPVCTATVNVMTLCAGKCGTLIDICSNPVNCDSSNGGATCGAGDSCGGGGTANTCGNGGQVCVPISSSVACAGKCGFVSDQCSGGYLCDASNGGVSCDANAGQSCGGGGTTGACGKPPCVPKTSDQLCPSDSCARGISDGCGGYVDCPACSSGQQCGIYMSDLCSTPVPPACTPKSAAVACANKCGDVADGCSGVYHCSASNGGVTCASDEWCGGSGTPNTCGKPACTPHGCGSNTCGVISNGCGGTVNCWPTCSPTDSASACVGTCVTNSACITQNGLLQCVAGGPACVGSLCASVPTNCGPNTQTALTGTVKTPGYVSNSVTRNQLPVPNAIVYIPASPATALPSIFEGVDAANPLSCGRCKDEKLVTDGQSVLAAAVTDYKGDFKLVGRIPVGVPFNLVVKIGKWRRVVQVPSTLATACQSAPLSPESTRLAANSSDGLSGTHLPKIAVSTGKVDEMECVFRNIGISESEFTLPTTSGRIHMYRANGARMPGATCSGTYNGTQCSANGNAGCNSDQQGCVWSNADSNLFNTYSTLDNYDLVVWDCEGAEQFEAAAPRANVENYVNAGGRMFASHFSYTWIESNGSLAQSADWKASGSASSGTGYISMTSGNTTRTGANSVKSVLLKNWLDFQGALTGTTAGKLSNPSTPQFLITDPRDRAGANVGKSTDEWMYRGTTCSNDNSLTCTQDSDCRVCSNNSSRACTKDSDCFLGKCPSTATCTLSPRVQQLSFNTPYGKAEDQICGRVAYSGFHVASASSNNDEDFPAVCGTGDLTAQEKILAFMLFDLATCVSAGDPPAPPECTPKTVATVCPNVNDACGFISDGCGGVIDCGGCATGYYCDVNTCTPQECTPSSCASLGFNCDQHADGCGGIARDSQGNQGCGTCSGNQVCGLGGPGLCGTATCTPIAATTACANKNCGQVSNGCGGTYSCGTCASTEVCGGGGANICGPGSCTTIAQATACANKDCGQVSDGCGGAYDCGTCTAPATCGGSGVANKCGQPSCTKKTQQDACKNLDCGYVSDGCSGTLNCGTCSNNGVCGGAGPNKCGSSCTATTCSAQGAECGAIADACGGILQCGTCAAGQTCGAQQPNKCGTGVSCTGRTCASASAECGTIGDGCGGVLDCGTCTAPKTCGGDGTSNRCGVGTGGCNKLTCTDQKVVCGPTSDGCGGVLDCGGCLSGYQCQAGQCTQLTPG